MDDRKHIVRQAILQTLRHYKRAPARPDEICTCYLAEAESVQLQEVVDEASCLITTGYVENLKPGRGLLLRITAKGLRQIEREETLDEFIWGDRAYQG